MTDDRQTDRQTDHATEKCVDIGEIACAALAIPLNNTSNNNKNDNNNFKLLLVATLIFSELGTFIFLQYFLFEVTWVQ